MAHPREICLEVDGHQIAVQVRRESRERSPRTGRELTELHGTVTIREETTHAWLSETLPELTDRVLSARDVLGDYSGRWVVSWNSYSVHAGAHSYSLILREAEELTLEALLVDGLELHPYEYREQVAENGLTIWAKLVGTQDDIIQMRRLMVDRATFAVVRHGISDEPRQMRVGVAEWSHFEDRIKYRVALVDAELRSWENADLARVEEENHRSALAFYANLVEHLTTKLVEKGVLDEIEVAELRDFARSEPGIARHELWRVPDVDDL
ncbi:hypothetical protein BH23GEM6_BH23GEM6_00350 [soil metagenome]